MNRIRRMKPIKDIAAVDEQDAAQRMSEMQRNVRDARKRLSELQAWNDEYMQRHGQGTLRLTQLQAHRQFMLQLASAIEQQKQILKSAEDALFISQEEWLKKHQRHNALSQVIEKYRREESRKKNRREQQVSDEFAARQHASYSRDGRR